METKIILEVGKYYWLKSKDTILNRENGTGVGHETIGLFFGESDRIKGHYFFNIIDAYGNAWLEDWEVIREVQ